MTNLLKISSPISLPDGFVEYIVNIQELVLPLCLGIYEHEINNPQPVSLSVDIYFASLRVQDSKGIDQVICYDVIIEKIRALTRQNHVFLVETFVDKVVDICLAYHQAYCVSVSASKTKIHEGIGRVGITACRHQNLEVFTRYIESYRVIAA